MFSLTPNPAEGRKESPSNRENGDWLIITLLLGLFMSGILDVGETTLEGFAVER